MNTQNFNEDEITEMNIYEQGKRTTGRQLIHTFKAVPSLEPRFSINIQETSQLKYVLVKNEIYTAFPLEDEGCLETIW